MHISSLYPPRHVDPQITCNSHSRHNTPLEQDHPIPTPRTNKPYISIAIAPRKVLFLTMIMTCIGITIAGKYPLDQCSALGGSQDAGESCAVNHFSGIDWGDREVGD